jgi:hypothetical protein
MKLAGCYRHRHSYLADEHPCAAAKGSKVFSVDANHLLGAQSFIRMASLLLRGRLRKSTDRTASDGSSLVQQATKLAAPDGSVRGRGVREKLSAGGTRIRTTPYLQGKAQE